jgi:5-(carboxyamino)imidazole ribonucleotide synthase
MTVGVLGGGQLGRMLALAGIPMGLRFRFLDPDPHAPSAQVAEQIVAPYDDPAALDQLAAGAQVVTYEFENVPAAVAQRLEAHARVHPPALALATLQDRLLEKQLFVECGVAVPEFVPASTRDDLLAAAERLGLLDGRAPGLVVKSRRMGYDGKGQAVLGGPALRAGSVSGGPALRAGSVSGGPALRAGSSSSGTGTLSVPQQIDAAWPDLAPRAAAGGLIVERFVRFTRELSLIGVRARDGGTRFYPLVQNHHEGGVLRTTIAPAPGLAPGLQQHAEDRARAIMQKLDYVGVLAIEFFESRDESGAPILLGNEMAPRVHNSGHWSIEGAPTSQFENHLRAILGWPLGDTGATDRCSERSVPCGPVSAMINILGRFPRREDILAIPGAHFHHYGKAERPGRKIGHVTVVADTPEAVAAAVARVQAALPG